MKPKHLNLEPDPALTDLLIERRYVPCEELFPGWLSGRGFLLSLCKSATGIQVYGSRAIDSVYLGFDFSLILDVDSGENLSYDKGVPEIYRDEVVSIVDSVLSDYAEGVVKRHINELNTELTLNIIKHEIWIREQHIVASGGRTAVDELKFRFGVM